MFIYDNSDPWYSLRMHDTDNPNVKMFVSDTKPHTVRMMDFDEATMQEMGTFVSEAVGRIYGNLQLAHHILYDFCAVRSRCRFECLILHAM